MAWHLQFVNFLSFAEIWVCDIKTKPVNFKNRDVSHKEFYKHLLIFGWYSNNFLWMSVNKKLMKTFFAAFILIPDLLKTSFLDVDHWQGDPNWVPSDPLIRSVIQSAGLWIKATANYNLLYQTLSLKGQFHY